MSAAERQMGGDDIATLWRSPPSPSTHLMTQVDAQLSAQRQSEIRRRIKIIINMCFHITVQPAHTRPCANRNPVYTEIIIGSRINYT